MAAPAPLPPALEVVTVPVPPGLTDTPVSPRHILDIHLGPSVKALCHLDGRVQRGVQTHGSFCLVPAGLTGKWRMARSAGALLVGLTPEILDDTAAAMGLRARHAELAPALHLRDPHIERLGWILQAEDAAGYPGGRLYADSLATAIAARLLALQERPAPEPRTARALPAWRLRSVVDYIDAHLDQDLTLAELAVVAGYSLSHFKALFKQAAGVPVHRYVLERRVDRARALVLAGGRSMAAIALEAGFAHQSHMARSMRRVLGVSPAQLAARGLHRP